MTTLKKGWTLPEAGHRKFIASSIVYALSKFLDRKKYEVVHEGNLDLHNPNSDTPDITVYERDNNYEPIMMIELCFDANEKDTVRSVEIIREIYKIEEAFVYNFESDHWNIHSQSDLFNIDLRKLLDQQLLRYF